LGGNGWRKKRKLGRGCVALLLKTVRGGKLPHSIKKLKATGFLCAVAFREFGGHPSFSLVTLNQGIVFLTGKQRQEADNDE
jgi:hypothetical protein